MQIVTALLALPDVRVVYKPHPRVAASAHPGVATAHRKIMSLVEAANAAATRSAGHVARPDGNILAMFGRCDALVGDVSSVTLDFLYLRPDAPIFLTDRRDDRALLAKDTPLTEGAEVIDSSTVGGFGAAIASRAGRRHPPGRPAAHPQALLRRPGPGDSSRRFEEAVAALIEERDHLLTGHKRVTTGDVDAHD